MIYAYGRIIQKVFFVIAFSLFICLYFSLDGMAQNQVSGRVTDDQSEETLPGVNISIKGTTQGTSTDANGDYVLTNISLQDTLIFSFVGYERQEVPVSGRETINITLQSKAITGQEMIVTGYMTQKKADLTGSVSVVSEKELSKDHGSTNILKSLQGQVPGMHITTDGSPAGNVGIQIRGLTSVNSAPPLIVIDGVPTHMNLRDLNGNNIASIQVLKDAASASIYGAQGASGVILVETKKGKAGETKVSYHGTFGVSDFMKPVAMLNTAGYGQALWQAAVNDGQDPNSVTQIYDYDWHMNDAGNPVLDKTKPVEWLNEDQTMHSANTNWLDAASQMGLQNNHQLTISGGNEKATSLLSLNFFQNQGTQIHTGYRRYTLRFNSDYTVINDHLTIGENLSASHFNINDQNQMHNMLIEPPIIPVYTSDGGWGGTAYGLGMGDYNNPVRELTLNKGNGNNYNKFFGNAYAKLTFLKHFNFKSQYGVIYTQGYHRWIDFTWEEGGGKNDTQNGVDEWQSQEVTLDFTNTLEYKANIGRHDLDVLAGIEANRYVTENMTASRQDIEFEDYEYAYLSTATGNQSVGAGGDKYNSLSLFSKFNYVYNSKYLLSASLRYDGSSKFGENNRFGLFPAVSAGWRLSNEKFLEDNGVISNLKLRASWGMNGNSNIPTTATSTFFVSDYNGTSYGIGGNESGQLPSGFRRVHTGNRNLQWEATRQTDVGVDFGLMDNRITGSVDYYNKFTDGMLYNPPYIGAIGEGGGVWVNAADMTNRGVELVMKYTSDPSNKFSYSIQGNISHNSNTINNLPDAVKYTYGGNGLNEDILGHPLHSFYGFIADGLFESQEEVDNSPEQPGKGVGRIRYKDLNHDGQITDAFDRTWIGSSDPSVEYGINFNANYKNFDFSMFWQGITGNTVYDGWKTYSDFWNVWVQHGFNHPARILDAWSPTNQDSDIPALSLTDANNELRMSTYFMESGSYLKLRNIEVGYSLPPNLTSVLGMEKLRVYILAQNILNLKKWWGNNEFTGPDPENPSGSSYNNPYVRPQIFKAGLDVTF